LEVYSIFKYIYFQHKIFYSFHLFPLTYHHFFTTHISPFYPPKSHKSPNPILSILSHPNKKSTFGPNQMSFFILTNRYVHFPFSLTRLLYPVWQHPPPTTIAFVRVLGCVFASRRSCVFRPRVSIELVMKWRKPKIIRVICKFNYRTNLLENSAQKCLITTLYSQN
jgi:hypothetical protein